MSDEVVKDVLVEEEERTTNESLIPEAEFAFMIIATPDGFTVRPLPEEANVPGPATHDDIYAACNTICRNIDYQQTAQAVGQAMIAAAMSQQEKQNTGIVVPQGVSAQGLNLKGRN